MVAPPARKPRQDTTVTAVPRLDRFALGRPPLLAVRWPNATGLASDLAGCFWLTGQHTLLTAEVARTICGSAKVLNKISPFQAVERPPITVARNENRTW